METRTSEHLSFFTALFLSPWTACGSEFSSGCPVCRIGACRVTVRRRRVGWARRRRTVTDERQFYLNGLVDEVMLFKRALTDTEIKTIYDAGAAGIVKPSR